MEDPTMNDLYTALSMDPPADPPTDPPADPPPADPPPAGDPPPADPATPPADPANPPADPAVDKAQQAFIHMRQQNKQYSDLLKGLAEIMEIPADTLSDPEKMKAALQGKVTAKQAEKAQVPVEMLERLNLLEQREQQNLSKQRERDMAIGLQRLAEAYKLTNTQLSNFAAELIESGVNPLTQQVNFIKEYRTLHFEDILKAEREAAVAAEQERAAKAGQHSSTPSSKAGDPNDHTPAKINNVRQLDDFFKANVKK